MSYEDDDTAKVSILRVDYHGLLRHKRELETRLTALEARHNRAVTYIEDLVTVGHADHDIRVVLLILTAGQKATP